MAPFPEIKSTHSLVAKHVTEEKWNKLGDHKTATSGFTLGQVGEITVVSTISQKESGNNGLFITIVSKVLW